MRNQLSLPLHTQIQLHCFRNLVPFPPHLFNFLLNSESAFSPRHFLNGTLPCCTFTASVYDLKRIVNSKLQNTVQYISCWTMCVIHMGIREGKRERGREVECFSAVQPWQFDIGVVRCCSFMYTNKCIKYSEGCTILHCTWGIHKHTYIAYITVFTLQRLSCTTCQNCIDARETHWFQVLKCVDLLFF